MALWKSGMENMVVEQLNIYRNKKVFVTGHTGFKGSWLIVSLQELGCEVYGFSLAPSTSPNHYELLNANVHSTIGDICNLNELLQSMKASQAEIVFHLAAQAIVRSSYQEPIFTYQVNVMGSLNVLEAARTCEHVKAIVMITTDKVYENVEKNYAYKETDRLGGYDMYSSSKACCEILINSYRNSYLNIKDFGNKHHILMASVRAGNVIGGGDWSSDRIIPDVVRACVQNQKVNIRNPQSVRPWQHVLDCVYSYLLVGSELLKENVNIATTWNVAPDQNERYSVIELLQICKQNWSEIDYVISTSAEQMHEANLLILDNNKIKNELNWKPKYSTIEAIKETIQWYKVFYKDHQVESRRQIIKYFES